jgi:hypothetical protein
MSHIFVSYSRKDIDFARYLRATYENIGFTVWMDEKRLSAGMNWSDELQKAIENCDAFVVIMSLDSSESKFVQSEILHALDCDKPMFPVLFVGEPFFLLKAYQYEDMRAGLGAKLSPEFIENLQQAIGLQLSSAHTTHLEIVEGNVLNFECDVLVFKYSERFRGADKEVALHLHEQGNTIDQGSLRSGEYVLQSTEEHLPANHILYIPTVGPKKFTYAGIRAFTEKAFTILADDDIQVKHVAMTIHGMGFGLDEHEALMAQIGGIIDFLQSDTHNLDIERVSIVERSKRRVKRLQTDIGKFLDEVSYAQPVIDSECAYDLIFTQQESVQTPNAGYKDIKPYALAILPNDEELEDIFFYGIQRPTHAMGLLCERIKLTAENDETQSNEALDIMLERIGQARIIICDVSRITPMLYLKLGYAWGKGVSTALITQNDDQPFQNATYIKYQKIWELEERLSQWLKLTLT